MRRPFADCIEHGHQCGGDRLKTETRRYGKTDDGQPIDLHLLANDNGMRAEVTNFGAILVSLTAPDRHGTFADVTLGYDDCNGWLTNPAYMGATVGRYGNRIARGRFTLDGRVYQLAANNGEHHLHGGRMGFDKVVWASSLGNQADETSVSLQYTSPDGEEGYPGTLTALVRYTLTNSNELRVEFQATTDQPTIVNLVHHSYWNLTADPRLTILDHEMMLNADRYLVVGPDAIPTGEMASVTGTPMDFTRSTSIGKRIGQVPGGYDHNWVLRGGPGKLELAARAWESTSGRVMEVWTDQPGVQFYTGNFLDGSIIGKQGIPYRSRCGFCLETQRWPDSPNHPDFPTAVLRPGETYQHTMVHKFNAR